MPTISGCTLFAHALQIIERDDELTLSQKKIVRDSRLTATETSCPGITFYGQLPYKQSASISRQVC